MSRFDYIKYDDQARALQGTFKELMNTFECVLEKLPYSREKSMVITKLEEAYMWIGKAVRNDQISRSLTKAPPLQEDRG